MKLFVSIYNDARLLGHFLRHYVERGVTHFYIAESADVRANVETLARGYPVTLCHDLDVADSILAGTAAVNEMRRRYQARDEWIVIVDLDEFVECADLRSVATVADGEGANLVRGIMHDRFALDGQTHEITENTDLSELFPVKSRFIRDVMGGCDHKGVLVKDGLQPGPGAAHHWFTGEHAFREQLEISHYKWISGSLERLWKSHRLILEAKISWADEHRKVFEHYRKYGRFAWETFGGNSSKDFAPEPPAGHCAECGGAISETERDYSLEKFSRPLCRTDQATPRGTEQKSG
jgi:hypothetical protein